MKISSLTVYEVKCTGSEVLLVQEALTKMCVPWTAKRRVPLLNRFRRVYNKFEHECGNCHFRKSIRFTVTLSAGELTLCKQSIQSLVKNYPQWREIEDYRKLLKYFHFRGVK